MLSVKRLLCVLSLSILSLTCFAAKYEYSVATSERMEEILAEVTEQCEKTYDETSTKIEYQITIEDDLVFSSLKIGKSKNNVNTNYRNIYIEFIADPELSRKPELLFSSCILGCNVKFKNIIFSAKGYYQSNVQPDLNCDVVFYDCTVNNVDARGNGNTNINYGERRYESCIINNSILYITQLIDSEVNGKYLFFDEDSWNRPLEEMIISGCTFNSTDLRFYKFSKVIKDCTFKGKSTLEIYRTDKDQKFSFYDNNILFFDDSKPLYVGDSFDVEGDFSCQKVSSKLKISGNTEPNCYVEFFVKNSNGVAVQKIGDAKSGEDGSVDCVLDYSSAEKLEGISVMVTRNISNPHQSFGFLSCSIDEVKDFYVKETGTGAGTSWTDAMGPEDFVKALQNCPEGSNFYVAAGEYDLKSITEKPYDVNVVSGVNIYGGYPSNSSSLSTRRNAKKYNTKIIEGGFDFKTNGPVSVKGVSFSDFYFSAGAQHEGNLFLDSCVFSKSAFQCQHSKRKNVSITNTLFEKGKVIQCTAEDNFSIAGCTFYYDKDDYSKGDDSSCIVVGTKSQYPELTLTLTNNTFVFNDHTHGFLFPKIGHINVFNNTIVSNLFHVTSINDSQIDYSNNFILVKEFANYINKGSANYINSIDNSNFKNNVVANVYEYGDNNTTASYNELCKVIDGNYADETELFTPNLSVAEGGFVPTIQLLSDRLPGTTTSIRFPRLSDVKTDANGVTRETSTCAGAVELEPCTEIQKVTNKLDVSSASSSEDVCKGLAAKSFSVSGVGTDAVVKVMQGEKEIETIEIAKNGTYATSKLPYGDYKLVYTATNDKGCPETQECSFTLQEPYLPLYRTTIQAYNANCANNGKFRIIYRFWVAGSYATNTEVGAKYPFYVKITDENNPKNVFKSDVLPATTDGSKWTNTDGDFYIENIPAGKYKVQFIYVTEDCEVIASYPKTDVSCVEYDRYGGHTQNIPFTAQTNTSATFNIYGPDLSNLDVKLKDLNVVNPMCGNTSEVGVNVDYTGFDTKVAKLRLSAVEKSEAEEKQLFEVFADANEGTLALTEMPVGTYDVKVQLLGIDGCEMTEKPLIEKVVALKTIADPSLDVESIKLYPPYCHATQNGEFSINIKNWNSECSVYLFYDNEQVWSADHIGYEEGYYGISGSLMKGLSATESEVNGLEVISDVTVAVSSMFGGTFTVGLQDQCGNRTTKEFELNSIEKPAFNVVSAYTDLSCSDSKDGSMSVALYGGRPEYARVYVNNVKQDVTEDSRTIRLSGLEPGSYTFKYESISRYCADNATFTVDVMVPDPMDITVVPEDVVCPADGASVNFTITGGTGDKNITLLDAEGEEVATATAEYSFDDKNAVAAVSGLMPGQVYSAKVEDANGCPAEAKDIEVSYKNQGDLTGIDAEITSAGQTCINRENGALTINYSGNTDEKELVFIAVDAKGGRHTASVSDASGSTTIDYLAKGDYTIYVDYNNGDCSVASPFAKKVATATIKDASTTSIKVEEIKCSGKVFSTVHFGNVESVLLYDAEDNVTAPSIIRGIISSTEEGSFERAYLTLINGCEQNATLEKTDETDNLIATFKELTVKYREKTEQSACDETTINDGSLTITLESSLDDPAYAYSIILKDAKGKVAGQIDDITDFSQSFEFRELAPDTYNGFLAVKVGDCLLESENKFFTEEISLNKETVAVERLAYSKPVEDVCKGTATLPFTVTGAIEGATVKVMKGEEEIESIAIEEDGDYSTSALEVGKYTLVYVATNANGCIEKDEKTTSYTKSQFVLPIKNTQLTAHNATCKEGGDITGEIHFASWSTLPYPFVVVVVDEGGKELKSQAFTVDVAANSEANRVVKIEDLPVGDYTLKTYFVADECQIEPSNATSLWQQLATTKLDGNSDYRTNNTFSIYSPDPIDFTYTAEDVTCAEDGASVTFKVENANGTPTVTLYNEEGKAVSTGMTIVDLKPGVTYSAKVEDENGCTAEIEEVKVTYKEQPSLEGIKGEAKPYNSTCVNKGNGGMVVSYKGNTDKKDLILIVTDTKGGRQTVAISEEEGDVEFKDLAIGAYTIYVDYNNGECATSSPAAEELDKTTIEAASAAAIAVEELHCGDKVYSNVQFGADMESVLLYDKDENATSVPLSRGVTSALVEGSFERAYLTYLNGCEQNATLDKTDETDNLVATFKQVTLTDLKKTEQSACDETTINDGSLTITLESTLENPAYSYSIILTDDKGKEINQIDDITDFTQPFVFNALAPGTYKGHLAVKVGDCLLEDEATLFSEEIKLNTESVAVNRLALGSKVEDVCKGTATLPFTVKGAIEGATVKVMKGEEEIESIAIAEDGDYSTSALEVGKYTLVYAATNEKGCIEKDENPFDIKTPTLSLPLYRSSVNASNANCMDNGKIVIGYSFYTRNSANDYECAIYPFYAKVTDVNSPEKEYKSDVQPASSDGKQWVNTKGTITFDNLPAGKYDVQFYYVTEGCDVMATFPASDVECREYDRFGGHAQQIPYSSIVNNTIPINIYAPDLSNLDVQLKDLNVVNPMCGNTTEVGVSVDYSGFDTKVAKLRLSAVEKSEVEEKQSFEVFADANEGTLALTEMPEGTYDVKVQLLGFDGCEFEDGVKLEQEVTIKALNNPSLVESSLKSTSPDCYKSPNGEASVTITNWNEKCVAYIYEGEEVVWSAKAIGEGTANGVTGLLQKSSDAVESTENGLKTISGVVVSASALSGGNYSFVLVDQCGEKQSVDFPLNYFNEPFFIVQSAHTNLDCASSKDGKVSVSLSGGSPEHTEIYVDDVLYENNSISLAGLGEGTYNFKYVNSSENCPDEVNFPVAVTAPDPIDFTFTAEDVTCAEDGASVTFKVENTNGTPTVTLYNEEGKAVSTGMTIVGLKPDQVYSAKVEDENGCAAEIEEVKVTYKEQPSLEGIAATVTAYDQSSVCENNGRLGIVFEGNSAESDLRFYTVDANGDTHAVTSSAASGNLSIRKLAAGDYTVYVDYNNDECSSASPYATEVDKATIEGIGQIAIDASSLVSVDPTCVSPANGQIDIDILNWGSGSTVTVYRNEMPLWATTEAYEKEYTSGAPCWFYYADADKKSAHVAHLRIPNVSGGSYKVEVDNGCDYVKDYTIELASLSKPELSLREDDCQLAIKCAGQETGVIAFNVGGGNASNLKAYINDEEVTPDKAGKCVKEGLAAGSYALSYKSTVEGCKDAASLKEPVEITVPEKLTATYNADNVVCAEQGAKVTFKVEGGTGNPTVTLYNEEGKAVSTGMTIVGLKPDVVYSAKVEDANGCSTEVKDIKVNYVEMPNLEEVTAEIFAYDESCHEGKNGRIVATFSGVTALNNVLFTIIGEDNVRRVGTINNAGTAAVFEELAPGEYTVYVDYDNGECSSSSPVAKALGTTKIVEMGQIAIDESSFVPTVATCTEPANGRVDIDILNWGRESGITVYRGDSPIWGTQVASLGEYSGSAPCQFYYEDKEKQEAHTAHLKIENINGGTYKVEVDNGCGYKTDYTITLDELAKPSITFNEDDSHLLLDCDYSKDGVLTFSVAGGDASTFGAFVTKQNESGEYTDETEVNADENGVYAANELTTGSYMLAYKSNVEGCKDKAELEKSIDIIAPEPLKLLFSVGKVECEATGATAVATVSGGTPGYTYAWTNEEKTLLGEKEEQTGLPEGENYQLVVKDSKKCLISHKFNVEPLTKTSLAAIKISNEKHEDQTCYGIDNGSITFSYTDNSAKSSLQFAVFDEEGNLVADKTVVTALEKDIITIDKLAPGKYVVKLGYGYEGCGATDNSITVTRATIEGLEKPKFLTENYSYQNNKCEGGSEGRMHLEMMGWKDGIYSWTLQRAGQSEEDLEVYTHHGELLENGATAFDLWGLPEGVNIFTIWDACENGFHYPVSQFIGADYVDTPALDVEDKVAFTCLDRKDGSFTFVASPWDVANTAKFKKDEEEAKDVHPSLKDGKAYFEYKEQGAGTYTLSVKDLCKRDVILPFDFTAFSNQNGALVANVDFDAEAAMCDVDKRMFTVTAAGGTAPYVYEITKADGTAVKTSEATEETSFDSDLLTDGSYKVTITDKTDCKAVYNGDLVIDPAHVMTAQMREVICGDSKTVTIVTSVDGGKIKGKKVVAVDEEGKTYPAALTLASMSFYSIPVDVHFKGVSAVVDGDCSVYAELKELPLDEKALQDAVVTVEKHYDQRCYQVNNGGLELNYKGPEMSYDVKMYLKYVEDGEDKFIETEGQHGTDLTFTFENLAPGEYELYLTHVMGKCDAGLEPRKIQDVTITELKEPLQLFKEQTKVHQSTCYSNMNAQAVVAVTGWVPNTYKEIFYQYKEDGSLEYIWSGTDANDISKDDEQKVHAWATQKNLTAGKYHTVWGDICKEDIVEFDFTVDSLKKPNLEILETSYTDLKCSYDKAYIDFKYEGGSTVNKRILFKFQPKGKGYDDWDWTTEQLESENTYRYYGHTLGDGRKGHDKAEGTDYELTDEDKGLADGTYTVIYHDSTGACEGDMVWDTVSVKRNQPINIIAYSRNVVCQDKAQGSLAFVFNRFAQDGETLATGPTYTDETFPNKYTGTNWANLMFLPDETQAETYHRGYNGVFGGFNDSQLRAYLKNLGLSYFLVNYYATVLKGAYPYRSNMFSDISKIEIISRNKSHEELYAELAKAVEDSMMVYPLREMYLDGKDYQVPTEWMGFKSLYPDFYNIVITDDLGCRYVSDTIEITVPSYKKPLTIDEVVFDAEAGYCDADKRRITFRASGGWGDYHYSAVNLDSADIDKSLEELPDDDETEYGKLLDKNYVADGHVEAFGQKGTSEYYEIYTTPIQKPGRIKISVVDSLGCTTTGGVYELTAKYLLSGLTQNDWCSPDENNNYYPVVLNGSDGKPSSTSVDSFKVRIGHRTVREDSVEYRKVLPNELLTYDKNADEEDAKYYGKRYIEKVPGGQVGFFAYMPDGCSAFNEDEFLTSDNFRKLTLTAEGNLAANCYLEPSGALQFSIYGGNDSYDKLYLDGRDLMTNAEIESIQKHSVTSKPIIENGEKVGVSVDTVHLLSFSFYEFATEDEFNTLNEKFNVEAGSTQDIKINYYFTLQNLVGNTNLIPPFEAKDTSHILIVQDAKGCRDTLDFKVDQPEKLQITAAGSVMCADGSGRIFVDQVSGGVGDYLYSLDDKESFDDNTHKPIVFGSKGHVLYVQDANNCVSEPSNTVSTGEAITWDDVEQDVMISTWHDYGDVLVVIDKTNYHALKYVSGENKGKPFEYHYDSIKVEIIRSEDFPVEVVGVVQPKEYYTYGIKGPSFDNVEGGETDVDTTGMHIDASGSVYKYVSWLQKNVYGPTWGVPEEVIASIKPDDQVQFLDKQYSIEKGALDDSVRNVVDKLCRNCGYLDKLRSMNRLSSQLYKSEADELKIEQLRNETDAIFAKYHQTAEASLNYDVKVEAMKQKYGFGYGTLSGIRSTFDKLVPDSAAERMTFIKFEENRTTGTNGTPAESVLEKYFSSNNDSETLSFGIRTTTYVSGCDITEEYNSLVLNLKGDNPYPNPDFKNTIRLECSPSVLTYPTEQQTELIVHMSKEEPFTYQVFGIDGKVLKTKTNNSSSPKTETNEDGETEYVFHIQLTGITQTCVVKVTTESNSAATKILVK